MKFCLPYLFPCRRNRNNENGQKNDFFLHFYVLDNLPFFLTVHPVRVLPVISLSGSFQIGLFHLSVKCEGQNVDNLTTHLERSHKEEYQILEEEKSYPGGKATVKSKSLTEKEEKGRNFNQCVCIDKE